MPLHTVFKQIMTPEQISQISVDEINALLRKELAYDDYRCQKENGIRIKENVLTKLAFATEEIYQLKMEQKAKKRKTLT